MLTTTTPHHHRVSCKGVDCGKKTGCGWFQNAGETELTRRIAELESAFKEILENPFMCAGARRIAKRLLDGFDDNEPASNDKEEESLCLSCKHDDEPMRDSPCLQGCDGRSLWEEKGK
jgi:hypothetical protein